MSVDGQAVPEEPTGPSAAPMTTDSELAEQLEAPALEQATEGGSPQAIDSRPAQAPEPSEQASPSPPMPPRRLSSCGGHYSGSRGNSVSAPSPNETRYPSAGPPTRHEYEPVWGVSLRRVRQL